MKDWEARANSFARPADMYKPVQGAGGFWVDWKARCDSETTEELTEQSDTWEG